MRLEDKQKIYEEGVLKPERHDRFLDEMDTISKRAGINGTPEYIWRSFPVGEFGPAEQVYLEQFKLMARENGIHGLVYLDYPDDRTARRMLEVTGLLVRNEVDARLMSRSEVLSGMRYDGGVSGSAILIPNFCPEGSQKSKNGSYGGSKDKGTSEFTEYQREALYDFLLKKLKDGGQVIISIDSYKSLEDTYGSAVAGHVKNFFAAVQNGSHN